MTIFNSHNTLSLLPQNGMSKVGSGPKIKGVVSTETLGSWMVAQAEEQAKAFFNSLILLEAHDSPWP